eukprot:1189484-Prorocentrum_minimum.AAC.2
MDVTCPYRALPGEASPEASSLPKPRKVTEGARRCDTMGGMSLRVRPQHLWTARLQSDQRCLPW